ncbi:MAG TPA: serine protease [Candidatus Moranbacteria bacterium]|nr:serine protease [Candidatus Moranbacteria bacterium]
MKKTIKLVALLLFIMIVGGFAGFVTQAIVVPWLASVPKLKNNVLLRKANDRTTVINKTEQITVKEDFSVTKTAERVLPAMVSIVAVEERKSESSLGSSEVRSAQDEKGLTIESSKQIEESVKTGVVISSDGLIVSVKDNTARVEKDIKFKYKVLMPNGREAEAELVAIDSYSGLAFYKALGVNNLSVAPFGEDGDLIAGEKLVLIGNSGGEYRNNFSVGIISLLDRTFSLLNSELSSSEKMEGAVIVEAKINRQNIGGPAVDFAGFMAGIAAETEKNGEKVGFVIPISVVKGAMERYLAEGKIERPSLGVYYLSINREIALLNNLPLEKGALIYSFSGQQGLAVVKGSAAEKAGLKLGDIILAVNDEEIDLDNPLSKLIAEKKKGDKVELKVWREGDEINLTAQLL